MMSDANRLPNTMPDIELLAYECAHYGIAPPSLYYLLRHIYGNRDAAMGAQKSQIESLQKRIRQLRSLPR